LGKKSREQEPHTADVLVELVESMTEAVDRIVSEDRRTVAVPIEIAVIVVIESLDDTVSAVVAVSAVSGRIDTVNDRIVN